MNLLLSRRLLFAGAALPFAPRLARAARLALVIAAGAIAYFAALAAMGFRLRDFAHHDVAAPRAGD